MTDIDRAQDYAAVFIQAGEDWRKFVPVDGTVSGDEVRIGSARLRPDPSGGWRIESGDTRLIVRAVAA